MVGVEITEKDAERFWSKVRKTRGCWLWQAGISEDGYGAFWLRSIGKKGNNARTNRVAYQLVNDEDPGELLVMHTCDNPICVKPDHLKLGTPADNSADMARKGRAATGKRNGKYTCPESIPRGEQHAGSKMTWKKVRRLRKMREQGIPYADLCSEFGVSRTTAFEIIKGKRWPET